MSIALLDCLDRFLAEHAARPHVWGEVDCCLVLADWGIANGYPDGAADLRGTYASAEACAAVVEAAGGLVPLVGRIADALGRSAIDAPERGCVAVIGSQSNRRKQWGAIFDGESWLVRQPEGFVSVKAHALRLWSV